MGKTYEQKKKFLLRFLKEHGVYSAYKKYIKDENAENGLRKCHPCWVFDDFARSEGIRNMITLLFVWSKTKEGFVFWQNIHKNFLIKYDKWINKT